MYANAKTLNDQVLKSRVIRATTRFSFSATEEDGAVVSLARPSHLSETIQRPLHLDRGPKATATRRGNAGIIQTGGDGPQ